MTDYRKICSIALLGSTLTLVASHGHAQEAGPAQSVEDEARRLFEQGVQAYGEGNLAEALTAMKNSYDLNPVPIVLFNLAMVQLESKDFIAAGNNLYKYMETEGNLTSERIMEVTRTIEEEIRPNASLIQIKGIEVGALVMIDGNPIGDGGIRYGYWVLPGTHRVELPEEKSKVVETKLGETLLVELSRPKEKKSLLPSYLVGGLGLAVAATGAGLLGWAIHDKNEVENAPPATPWTDIDDNYERTTKLQIAGFVLLGIGVASLVTGGVLLGMTIKKNRKLSEHKPIAGFLCHPASRREGCFIGIMGKF